MTSDPSYYSLRRGQGEADDVWWLNASKRKDLPAGLLDLAAGRTRVELTRSEAAEALSWLEQLADRVAAEIPPVFVHPSDPRAATA